MPDDLFTSILKLLSLKDLSRLDSALCVVNLRHRYLAILSLAHITSKISMAESDKYKSSPSVPHIFWAILRNIKVQEVCFIGCMNWFDPIFLASTPLMRNAAAMAWFHFEHYSTNPWLDSEITWQLPSLVSLSIHAERRPLDVSSAIRHVALRCPQLQILKLRSATTVRYSAENTCFVDLINRMPHLHTLFLWNVVIEDIPDLTALFRTNKFICFGEQSVSNLHMVHSAEVYDKAWSRVCVQKRVSIVPGCPQNQKAIHIAWSGLSTNTMGEYIAEVVPNLKILHTSFSADCVFALPVLRYSRNHLQTVCLQNGTHLTTDMLQRIVTLPHLHKLGLYQNNTIEQIVHVGSSVLCTAAEVKVVDFSSLAHDAMEKFLKCCPNLQSS